MNESTPERSQALPKSLLFWLAIASLTFGFLSGMRWPSLWSMTLLLFDYSSGLMKRGLVGEIVSLIFGQTVSYGVLAAISFGIFLIWVVMLFLRLGVVSRIDQRIWLFAVVFLLSPGFVFLVHDIGFFDHLGLIVVFLCFSMPPNMAGLLGRAILCLAMTFVHEGFFLMFFPVVGFEFWIRAELAGKRHLLMPAFLLVAMISVATFAMGQLNLSEGREAEYVAHLQSRAADFAIQQDAVRIVFREGPDNFALAAKRWSSPNYWGYAALGIFFWLPLTAGLILVCRSILRRAPLPEKTRKYLFFGVVVSALSPLLLNIVARDIWRFFGLTQMAAFLALIAVIGHVRVAIVPAPLIRRTAYGFTVLAVLGAYTATPLFDHYEVVKPPFIPHLTNLFAAMRGETSWLQIPER